MCFLYFLFYLVQWSSGNLFGEILIMLCSKLVFILQQLFLFGSYLKLERMGFPGLLILCISGPPRVVLTHFITHLQDLAGDVCQNLKEFFQTLYKKVIIFSDCQLLHPLSDISFLNMISFVHRSLRLILKSLKQAIEALRRRKRI